MARRSPRFEIVRTDAGWHARFIAGNGRKVWWTENYTRRGKAVDAILLLDVSYATRAPEDAWTGPQMRDVDERTTRGHAHP